MFHLPKFDLWSKHCTISIFVQCIYIVSIFCFFFTLFFGPIWEKKPLLTQSPRSWLRKNIVYFCLLIIEWIEGGGLMLHSFYRWWGMKTLTLHFPLYWHCLSIKKRDSMQLHGPIANEKHPSSLLCQTSMHLTVQENKYIPLQNRSNSSNLVSKYFGSRYSFHRNFLSHVKWVQ